MHCTQELTQICAFETRNKCVASLHAYFKCWTPFIVIPIIGKRFWNMIIYDMWLFVYYTWSYSNYISILPDIPSLTFVYLRLSSCFPEYSSDTHAVNIHVKRFIIFCTVFGDTEYPFSVQVSLVYVLNFKPGGETMLTAGSTRVRCITKLTGSM